MNSKSLFTLIAVTIAVVLVAALTLKSSKPTVSTTASSTALAPDLADKINSVTKLELKKGDVSLTVVQQGTGKDLAWVVANRGNYPAKFDKVKEVLVAISEAKLLEKKTNLPDKFAALEIDDPSATAKSTLVTIYDDKSQPISSVVIGKMAKGPGGRGGDGAFVRKAGDNQVWQSDLKQVQMFDVAFREWVDPTVIQLERSRIQTVNVVPVVGDRITISKAKAEDVNFTLENKPANKELKYPGAADALSYPIGFLDMTDVMPAASIDFAKDTVLASTFSTFDGLVATATISRADGKHWVKLSFATDFSNTPESPAAEPVDPTKPPNPAPQKPKTRDEVTKEAADLNARHSPWAYQIVDSTVNQFAPKLEDLLKDPEPPAAPAAPITPLLNNQPLPEK